jgi:hypothetical protein
MWSFMSGDLLKEVQTYEIVNDSDLSKVIDKLYHIMLYRGHLIIRAGFELTTLVVIANRIILRPLSALFGLQFMLTMEKSVTFIGACANIFLCSYTGQGLGLWCLTPL